MENILLPKQIQAVLKALGVDPFGHFLQVPKLAKPLGQIQFLPFQTKSPWQGFTHNPPALFTKPLAQSQLPVLAFKT